MPSNQGRQEVSERNEITLEGLRYTHMEIGDGAHGERRKQKRVLKTISKFSALFTGFGSLINLIYMNMAFQLTSG